MSKRYIGITETATIIRAELKRAFPAVKFSVTSKRYSMGSNITVGWTDGPSTKAVTEITDRFYGTGFDSMTDSTTHHDNELNGEIVHFSGSRPHVVRHISEGFETTALTAWQALESTERCKLLNRHDFPAWPEERPGYRLACWLSAP